MGVYNNGVNGPFSGKTGSIIGSRWRGVDYIKGFPRRYKNKGKPSDQQQLHYKKFNMLNEFLRPIRALLKIGFGNYLKKLTAQNAAFQYNFDRAFLVDEHGEPTLNYSALQLSRGSLFSAGAEKVEWVRPRQIRVSWNPKTYGLSGSLDDEVHILCYTAQNKQIATPDNRILRHQGEVYLSCGALEDEVIHVWLFFSDSQQKMISPTTYLSIVNVQ